MAKIETVTIRVTSKEKEALKKHSQNNGLSLSDFIKCKLFTENFSPDSLKEHEKFHLSMQSQSLSILQALAGKAFNNDELEEIKNSALSRMNKKGF